MGASTNRRCTHNCNQGRTCTCRPLPIQYSEEQLKRWGEDDVKFELEDWLTIGSAIALALMTLLWLFYVVGGWL